MRAFERSADRHGVTLSKRFGAHAPCISSSYLADFLLVRVFGGGGDAIGGRLNEGLGSQRSYKNEHTLHFGRACSFF